MMPNRTQRQQLIEKTVSFVGNRSFTSDNNIRQAILRTVAESEDFSRFDLNEKKTIANQIFADMRGFDILQKLIDDDDITEIMVNGPNNIFYEKKGKISKAALNFEDQDHLKSFICRCFGRANKLINEQNPLSGMKLNDGSRVQAVLNPVAVNGPYLCIRRFKGIKPEIQALINSGFISSEIAEYIKNAVINKKNIFISGGTGTGKTTFLNAMSAFIPPDERVITIEDAAELDLQGITDLVRLEARQATPDGSGQITLSALIKAALRLRPDRIIVGEVRGQETYDMIQAMNTGHPGSMSTGHGNSCLDMLERLSLMIIMHSHLPWEACRRLVSSAVNILIQLSRNKNGERKIEEIIEISGYESGEFTYRIIFSHKAGD